MLIVPGAGLNAFELHELVKTAAALANAVETAQNGKMKPTLVYPLALAAFFARDDAVANQLSQPSGGRLYRNRPNVVIERTWYAMDQGSPHAVLGFDIVDNSMAGVGMDATQAATANLARGYADEKIEGDVLHGGTTYNTIAIFNSGVAAQVIAAGGNVPGAAGNLADGLSETLTGGHIAIAPSDAVMISGKRAYGWWDVDPSTGSAVGRMTGGAGDAMAEYAFMISDILGGIEAAAEMAEADKECGEDSSSCAAALCSQVSSGILLYQLAKHALHVHNWAAAIALVVMDSVKAALAVGFCKFTLDGKPPGGEGGGHGGEGGGGAPPENGPPYEHP